MKNNTEAFQRGCCDFYYHRGMKMFDAEMSSIEQEDYEAGYLEAEEIGDQKEWGCDDE